MMVYRISVITKKEVAEVIQKKLSKLKKEMFIQLNKLHQRINDLDRILRTE